MSNSGWRQVTRAHPCRICGADHWCNAHESGAAQCRQDNGAGHPFTNRVGEQWFFYPAADAVERRPPLAAPEQEDVPRAEPQVLDRVYRELLAQLNLLPPHREQLRGRGLSDVQIQEGEYRSLPRMKRAALAARLVEVFGAETCARVPGLFVKESAEGRSSGRYWSLAGATGLLIPVRDPEHRIVALKVRADDGEQDG